jgi:crotonobetainyl-CoA:carnitine CoA-transferase CaiB-like acyl-CoA transferase
VHDIIASADAVVDDHVWVSDLASRHPDVVFCAITPFGQGAPADLQNAKSINVFHASGWGYHTPSHPDPAKPPLKGPGRFLADYEAGLDAALCVASSLFARLHRGDGEFIDLSADAVLVSRADCILGRSVTGEIAPENIRDDYDRQGPASFFACRDGHVYLYMTSRSHWIQLKQLMRHHDAFEPNPFRKFGKAVVDAVDRCTNCGDASASFVTTCRWVGSAIACAAKRA